MKNSSFFNEEFDAGTQTKLTLLDMYVRDWLPTFINSPSHVREIHIFDLFCGPGESGCGEDGSPVIIVKEVLKYCRMMRPDSPPIKLFFSDKESPNIRNLKKNPTILNAAGTIDITIQELDFESSFAISRKSRLDEGIATFIFLDQFGLIHLTKDKICELSKSPKTDWMAFLSSSFHRRFIDHPNFANLPQINYGALKDSHRELTIGYKKWVNNPAYFILPFSIKKHGNIYGLVFGTGHPLGADKFLQICWSIDRINGEANYSMDNPKASCQELPLLPPSKLTMYQNELKQLIMTGSLRTNKDVYIHALLAGISAGKARDAMGMLVKKGILRKKPALSYGSIYKKHNVAKLETA